MSSCSCACQRKTFLWTKVTKNGQIWPKTGFFVYFIKKNVVNFLLKTFLKKHWYCFLSSCVNFISRKISAFQLWLEMFSTNKIAGFGTIYLITKQKKSFRWSVIFSEVAGHHFCFTFNVWGSFATLHLLFYVILSKR